MPLGEGGREGGREGRTERRTDRGREGGREGEREGGREDRVKLVTVDTRILYFTIKRRVDYTVLY